MKLLSAFSGIGAFEKALDRLGIDYDLVNFCEFDKYAIKSYCAIHGTDESKNLGDITAVDETKLPKDFDLFTYGFPCQPFSIAGNQEGFEDGKGRGNLFFDALRIIDWCKPKIAIAENVKNLTSKRFANEFQTVLQSLEEAGYNNYWAVKNAKNFGVPQNRERVFIVSVRKDLDRGRFQFPEGFPLTKCLGDVMDQAVDEKYFVDGKYESITRVNENYCMLNGGTIGKMHDQSRRAYFPEYISPTIHTSGGDNQEPKVVVRPICLNSKGGRAGIEGLQPSLQDRVYDSNGISTAVTTSFMPSFTDGQRIRKLTEKEQFRLMGFDDADYDRAADVVKATQLKKQAGNSIVVPVLEAILSNIFDKDGHLLV